MPGIKVRVDSTLVRQGLQDLDAEVPLVGRRTIYNRMLKIKTRLRTYPPPPESSKYVRTMELRNSVEIQRLDSDDGYRIEVDPVSPKGVHYGMFPLGNAWGTGQAWMHQGRWPLLRDVVDQEIKELPPEIGKEIIIVARRKGFTKST